MHKNQPFCFIFLTDEHILHAADLELHFSSLYLCTSFFFFYTLAPLPHMFQLVSSQAASELRRISKKNLAADKQKPEPRGTVADLSRDTTGLQTVVACLIGRHYRRRPGLLQSMKR